jgi:hypothetical protein
MYFTILAQSIANRDNLENVDLPEKKMFFFLFDILLLRRSHLTFLCTFGIPSSYSVCLSFVGFV